MAGTLTRYSLVVYLCDGCTLRKSSIILELALAPSGSPEYEKLLPPTDTTSSPFFIKDTLKQQLVKGHSKGLLLTHQFTMGVSWFMALAEK